MEQLLLVTSCDSPAGIGASLRTHVRTDYSGAKNKSDANQKSQIFQKSLLVQKQTIYHWKAL